MWWMQVCIPFLCFYLFALNSFLSTFSRTGKLSLLFRSLPTFNYLHFDVGFQSPCVTRKISFYLCIKIQVAILIQTLYQTINRNKKFPILMKCYKGLQMLSIVNIGIPHPKSYFYKIS